MKETACAPRMTVDCEYCHLAFPLMELQGHTDYCGSRTDNCDICGARVTLQEMDAHLRGHNADRTFFFFSLHPSSS
jgi:methionyl-tRNA synthetase